VSPILLRGPLRKNDFAGGLRGTPGELIGTEIAERTVWMVGVVIATPMSSLNANIGDRREPIGIQQLLSYAVVERLAERVV